MWCLKFKQLVSNVGNLFQASVVFSFFSFIENINDLKPSRTVFLMAANDS